MVCIMGISRMRRMRRSRVEREREGEGGDGGGRMDGWLRIGGLGIRRVGTCLED